MTSGEGVRYTDVDLRTDRVLRLIGTGVVIGAAFAFVDGPVRYYISAAAGVLGLLYVVLGPADGYVVTDDELIHQHWPRRDAVNLSTISNVTVRTILYSGFELRLSDSTGGRVDVTVSEGSWPLREAIGERLREIHPQIGRTSRMSDGAARSLGLGPEAPDGD